MKKYDDDYKVALSGTTISKTNANKAGLGLIFGIAGAVFSIVVFGNNKLAAFVTITICIVVGLIIANKIFKK